MTTLAIVTGITPFLLVEPAAGFADKTVPQWTVHEQRLRSSRDYEHPLQQARVEVRLESPSGSRRTIHAFWDGGRTWRFRVSPDEIGRWRWKTVCSDPGNGGLHGQTGEFHCTEYEGDNPLYRRGAVRTSENRRYFVHADGTPFFWLADTAWNGVLRSRPDDWTKYLQKRREQKFTAIQFVSTQWRGAREILEEHAFIGENPVRVNPEFFQRLDPKVAEINRHGLIAAPVVLWALTEADPGRALPVQDAVRLAEYIVARWGAYQVIWLLGGDGRYQDTDRWRRIGRAVFGERPHPDRGHNRLVTLHASGLNWVGDDFAEEPWLDFLGYQSGHGDADSHLKWLVQGPPAEKWNEGPDRPVINMEPNYEAHPAYHSKQPHGPHHVRRAAYWSLTVHPPAGLTYGHNAIWVWNDKPARAEGHGGLGIVQPWHTGLETDGIRSITIMREFFDSRPWMTLRPAQTLLAEQPGRDDPKKFITAALSEDRTWAVVYTPVGGTVTLKTDAVKNPAVARWFNPRTGKYGNPATLQAARQIFTTPDEHDWVLDIRSK